MKKKINIKEKLKEGFLLIPDFYRRIIILSLGGTIFVLVSYAVMNFKVEKEKHTLLFISLDGFRHDYMEKFKPPFLTKYLDGKTRAKGLIPPFPSKTFPSHLSMITGLNPGRHGIVSNKFFDPDLEQEYGLKNRSVVQDPKWYQGQSVWSIAESAGLKTHDYFYPGGTTKIGKKLPTDYRKYDHHEDINLRIRQIINWIKAPNKRRADFISTYFHQIDTAGNTYGTDSDALKEAIFALDKALEKLFTTIDSYELPVTIVLVSDHGMKNMDPKKLVPLYEWVEDLDEFKVIRTATMVQLYTLDDELVEKTYEKLIHYPNEIYCFKSNLMHEKLQFSSNPRIGNLFIISKGDHVLMTSKDDKIPIATHGFVPADVKEMKGIFYAWGPLIKSGVELGNIDNVNIYPLLLNLLGLEVPKDIDGKLGEFENILDL